MYEIMRYWNDDHPEWDVEERAFAAAWWSQPKWVVSGYFAGPRPPLRLMASDRIGEDVIRLTYVPA